MKNRFLNFSASSIILAFAILPMTFQVRADQQENAKIGHCIGMFGTLMNTYALNNNAGGVKYWSLQYARAYVTYAAINIKSGGQSKANEINKEISYYAEKAAAFVKRTPDQVTKEASSCHSFVNPIYVKLELSGFKLDSDRPDTLGDTAYALAAAVRKDLGY